MPETIEQERRRVWGACGGACGEPCCIEWNKQEQVRLQRQRARLEARAERLAVAAAEHNDLSYNGGQPSLAVGPAASLPAIVTRLTLGARPNYAWEAFRFDQEEEFPSRTGHGASEHAAVVAMLEAEIERLEEELAR